MIILEEEPYEILDARPQKRAQRETIIQSKVKNLLSGRVLERNFHQGDTFEEAELTKLKVKFLYGQKDRYFFCQEINPSQRFALNEEQIGPEAKFLKANQPVEGVVFNEKVVNILLPIKIQLKVTEAPPGVKGERAQAGTKQAILETGATINVPLFVETGDIIEINTETEEYVRRVE